MRRRRLQTRRRRPRLTRNGGRCCRRCCCCDGAASGAPRRGRRPARRRCCHTSLALLFWPVELRGGCAFRGGGGVSGGKNGFGLGVREGKRAVPRRRSQRADHDGHLPHLDARGRRQQRRQEQQQQQAGGAPSSSFSAPHQLALVCSRRRSFADTHARLVMKAIGTEVGGKRGLAIEDDEGFLLVPTMS